MTKLKPCPFCGGKAKKVVFGLERYKTIGCEKCGVLLPLYRTLKETIEAWNNRPSLWHTGTPTEEGLYWVFAPQGRRKYTSDCFVDGNFLENGLQVVAWQKIEPYEEKE